MRRKKRRQKRSEISFFDSIHSALKRYSIESNYMLYVRRRQNCCPLIFCDWLTSDNDVALQTDSSSFLSEHRLKTFLIAENKFMRGQWSYKKISYKELFNAIVVNVKCSLFMCFGSCILHRSTVPLLEKSFFYTIFSCECVYGREKNYV